MATNSAANGVTHKFNPHFTQNVINAIGPKASPRMTKVIGGLIRHLHDFCREEEITVDEWMAAVEFVSQDLLENKMKLQLTPDRSTKLAKCLPMFATKASWSATSSA
jgi:hypothetical protein